VDNGNAQENHARQHRPKRKAESAHDLLTNCTGRVSFTMNPPCWKPPEQADVCSGLKLATLSAESPDGPNGAAVADQSHTQLKPIPITRMSF